MLALKRKVAVVTGAGNGIGRTVALRFARDGAVLALMDIDKAGIESLGVEIQKQGGDALSLAVDCTNTDSIVDAFYAVRKELGPVEILVNNVGQSARERMTEFCDANLDTLEFLLALNLKSCIVCSRQVVNDMRDRHAGRIINVASESAVNGSPLCWDYAAAKAGVIGFTRAIARELASFGIAVNVVAPGITRTRALTTLPEAMVTRLATEIPMKRFGEAEDIANAIAFFASDQSGYVTGQTLLVNGGNWFL